MRVKNYSDETLTPTDEFMIVDTEGNESAPVPLDRATNPFVYEPIVLQHAQVLPTPDTAAASGPIQGSLILFRLKTDSLQNRPLELEIEQGEGERRPKSTSTSSRQRGLEDGAGRGRGGVAARALADEHHRDGDRRLAVGRERDEPGVGVASRRPRAAAARGR